MQSFLPGIPQELRHASFSRNFITLQFVVSLTNCQCLQANGVIGVQLGTQQPHFSFVWQGETLLTESGQNALFIILALFLRQCSRKGGAIGGRSVDTLNLGPVANPPKIALSLRRLANAFRMW